MSATLHALSSRAEILAALRAQVGAMDGSVSADRMRESAWLSTPRGALVEIVGPARTDLMVKLLAEHTGWALWVEKEFSVYPLGLCQRGVDLSRLLFVESPQEEIGWVLGQALQAQVFPLLVASDFQFSEKELRRLQLLSERSGSTTFLLAQEHRPSWVPQLVVETSYVGRCEASDVGGGGGVGSVGASGGDGGGVGGVADRNYDGAQGAIEIKILRRRGGG